MRPEVFATLRDISQKRGVKVYLVGGFLRDALVARTSRDVDFLVLGDALGIARDLAFRLGGDLVILDDRERIYRVILKGEEGALNFDFSGTAPEDLRQNLLQRDFTVNSMALDLDYFSPGEMIKLERVEDPAGGLKDLAALKLRVTRRDALARDPVRILRAVRLKLYYGFEIETNTLNLMKKSMPELKKVAPERVRDEIFAILSRKSKQEVEFLEKELKFWSFYLPKGTEGPLDLSSLAYLEEEEWGRHLSPNTKNRLWEYLLEELVPGRPRLSLMKLGIIAGLIQSGDSSLPEELARAFALSRDEEKFLFKLNGSREWVDRLVARRITPLRFFFTLGVAAPGALMASCEFIDPQEISPFLDLWGEQPERVTFRPLLGGEDILALGLLPGPQVGRILEQVREAQLDGVLSSREEALALAASLVKNFLGGNEGGQNQGS